MGIVSNFESLLGSMITIGQQFISGVGRKAIIVKQVEYIDETKEKCYDIK